MIDVDGLLDQAFLNFNKSNYDLAELQLSQAQLIVPTHGDVLYLLGLIALRKKILTKALDFLTTAVRLYPKQFAYQEALADVYFEMNNFQQAQEIYTHLVQSPPIILKQAWVQKEMGNVERAKDMFQSLLATDQVAQATYALACFKKGKEKLKGLEKSFTIEPNAQAAEAIVRESLALSLKQDLSIYISYVQDLFLLAQYYTYMKDFSNAQVALEKQLKENPYHMEAWVLKGQIEENFHKQKEAEFDYNQALSIDKKSYDAHKYLARLQMKQSRFSEALDHYQIICRLNPEDQEVLLAMALLSEKTHNYEEALGIYFRLITLGKKALDTRIKHNILQLYQQNKDLAKQFIRGWYKSFPKNRTAKSLAIKFLVLFFAFSMPVFAQLTEDETNWQLAWENKMAEMGDTTSQYYLGELFETGKKVPKDTLKAIQFYEKAAQKGYLPATIKLGKIFAQKGPYFDEDKSIQWYIYAAEKGEVQAQFYLADYFQNSSNKDYVKAKNYLEKALKQTFPETTDYTQVSPQYENLIKQMNKKVRKQLKPIP